MNALVVRQTGALRPETLNLGVLAPDRLRVRVKYAGVGFADVMAVRGGYPLAPSKPFSPGYEFAGRVEEVGTGLSGDGVLIGERVAGMLPQMGTYREVIDVAPQWCVRVPETLSDQTAALVPLNYLTAQALLTRMTNLKRGQSVLIHGAGGGVGSAVLELARLAGLRAFGTASADKIPLVRSLGAVALNRSEDWAAAILSREPQGLDAVFDAFGGVTLDQSWGVLGPKGTLVSYGFSPTADGGLGPVIRGLVTNGLKTLFGGGRRAAVCGTPRIIETDPLWYRATLESLLDQCRNEVLKPKLHAIVPWHRVDEAHRTIAEGRVQGKMLLDFS